jgi:DNA-binding CsgD family transcriptional regulator
MLDHESTGGGDSRAYSSPGYSHGYNVGAAVGAAGLPGSAVDTGYGWQRGTAAAEGRGVAALAHWLIRSLDHVGRGMLLVSKGGQVLHANRLACSALAAGGHALMIEQGRLGARNARDAKQLADAIEAAISKGLRRMLTLGRGAEAGACREGAVVTVAVLPIEGQAAGANSGVHQALANAVLISLPQPDRGKDLAVQIFAREHGCTRTETAVLEALLGGQTPEAIAQSKKVQLCTVRTQIGQLRLKTGSHTIRELLDRVAALPPMMVVVQ